MEKRSIYYNHCTYPHAVEQAGGIPLLIPFLERLEALEKLLACLDGLFISGGLDVDPSNYGEEPRPALGMTESRLDELEIALVRLALKNDIPTLGVCRGMQLMNVALGGSLYQDLQTEYSGSLQHANWDMPRDTITHQIEIEPKSQLERILGARELPVNSLHHQAIKTPGAGIYVSARAEDGVAEALEAPEQRFMVAVQCNPEELYRKYPAWARLFRAFIKACLEQAFLLPHEQGGLRS